MHIFNHVPGPVLQLWARLSDDSCWQIVLHQSRSTCPRQTPPPTPSSPHNHTHPATLFSSRPEWIWGLTQQSKTNKTSARTSVSKATSQLTFELTVVHQLSFTSTLSVVACPWKQSVSSLIVSVVFCLCMSRIWNLLHIHLAGGANRRCLNGRLPENQKSFVQLLQVWAVTC